MALNVEVGYTRLPHAKAVLDTRARIFELLRALAVDDIQVSMVAGDVSDMVARAGPSVAVVCTLKDAVKLVPLWPRAGAALWYVSQTVVVEQGAEILEQVVALVLAARRATTPTAG
jgi:hypothetical protein